MDLYYTHNLNPRVAVATARSLKAPVDFIRAEPKGEERFAEFTALHPNNLCPVLVEDGEPLWEADAIACRLSGLAGSDLWRVGKDQPDMIRWLSWARGHFMLSCDKVHFERVTKPRYNLGPTDAALVAEGLDEFAFNSAILNRHLADRQWLLGDEISYADFRMASVLPFADIAGLPIHEHPEVARWYAQLDAISAWKNPFDGLSEVMWERSRPA